VASTARVDPAEGEDPVRERLLDAAAQVFAEAGYEGTRIHEVVRRAGLSTGAVYGRFSSRDDLVRNAVITRSLPHAVAVPAGTDRVADLVERLATRTTPALAEHEALLLEAYVAARRHPEIADAIAEADAHWRRAAQVLVDAARRDGTVADDVDPDAVLFLVRVLRLGLLLHRASGLPEPAAGPWSALVARIVAGIGAPAETAETTEEHEEEP
jgi:AcrR family transcriptional regulator